MIHTLITGALFAVGFFGASLLIILVLLRREGDSEKREAPKRATKLDEMTDGQIRQKIITASAELDLWIRAATVRGIRVDGHLLKVDGKAGARPQFRIRVYDHAGGSAEWPQGSLDGAVFF